MRFVFIGAGNLATNLSLAIYQLQSHQILQVYSRTMESASTLATQLEAEAITDIDKVDSGADIYIFALKDDVLSSILMQMRPNRGLWLHTAGSLPLSLLTSVHTRSAVLYPFQTFSKNRFVDFTKIPIFLETESNKDLLLLKSFCFQLSNLVYELSSEKRQYLHLTGVFACNFVNHLYVLANEILGVHDIPFQNILPLIDETASKVHNMIPLDAQTGPAIRYDVDVMNKQLSLIRDESTKRIYELMSQSIHIKSDQSKKLND